MAKKKKNKKKNKISEAERLKILARYSTKSQPSQKKTIEISDTKTNSTSNNELKSPICCFMGHVDAGKTSLMDVIRNSNVADNEAGKITQSIGSSFVDIEKIKDVTKNIKGKFVVEKQIPGLLVIDTPGHKAFSNLRSRGSSICDLAILVIDIIDGVKPQTIESIKMLIEKKVPFVIAATKIDMIYGWEKTNYYALRKAMKTQSDPNITNMMISYIETIKYDLEKENVKSEFYFNNKNPDKVYSIIPVSSKSKEGLADILSMLVYLSQNWMNKKITYRDKVKATIMESRKDSKIGWVIDIILSNGTIKVGDKYALLTQNGPKIISIRNLIVTTDGKEEYKDSVRASSGVRIIASNVDKCYAGTNLHVINSTEEEALNNAKKEFESFMDKFNFKENGIIIQAPTIGELEAIYQLFDENDVKIKNGYVNALNDKDFMKVESQLEYESDEEYRCLAYFGELVGKEREKYNQLAQKNKIKLITSNVIYQLLEEYKKFYDKAIEIKKKKLLDIGEAIYPCEIKILKDHIYMTGGSDDILLGVKVVKGKLCKNTPLVTLNKTFLGNVTSIQKEKKDLEEAKVNDEVCIRISHKDYICYGRHFTHKDKVFSKVTGESIKLLGKYFRKDLKNEDWVLIKQLINIFQLKKKKSVINHDDI
jgi:translation initiation factor 5B